ncbi:hypothetical protein GCM10008983_25960 [Lentibacillus halophilus]|uniref:HD domain-containing protein n=1 Tax=Lentibacillus halophilus TaxID=295065 RepID=A0ABP3JA06_9BACI
MRVGLCHDIMYHPKNDESYQTDEFMVITNIYDFNTKVRSYQLLAETFNLYQ